MHLSQELAEAVESSRARIRVGYPWWLRPWIARGVVAITLGRRIFVEPAYVERAGDAVERLIRHELAHVRQMNRLTLPLFLIRYCWEFLVNLSRSRSLACAYRDISFEREACAAEEEQPPSRL